MTTKEYYEQFLGKFEEAFLYLSDAPIDDSVKNLIITSLNEKQDMVKQIIKKLK